MPTTTVYLDFGGNFPGGSLQMTVEELADDINGPDFSNDGLDDDDVLTFTPFANFVTFDYNADSFVNAADVTDLRNAVITLVQRYFAPFDVNVVVAPALDNTDDDTYRQGIADTLAANNADPTGRFDVWVLIAGMTPSQGGFGLSPGDDSGSGNGRDDTVLVYADAILGSFGSAAADTAMAYTTAHEPGHSLGLLHTDADASGDNDLQTRSDLIVDGASGDAQHNRQNLVFFTRYNLPRDPEDGGGTQNNYDTFVTDPDIGARVGFPAYVTGTGAFDRITITRVDGVLAAVSVEAHRDNSFANQIGGTYNYLINYTNGILVEGGFSQDQIIIDASLGVNVTVRGMAGNDELVVLGNGAAAGSYAPAGGTVVGLDGNTNFSGTVVVGSTTITFDEYETAGSITVQDVGIFTFTTPNDVDDLDIDAPQPGRNRVSGTSGGVGFVPLTFFNITSFTINTGAATDTVTVDSSGLVASGLQNFAANTGTEDDLLEIFAQSYALPLPGGSFSYNSGGGGDKVYADADVDLALTDTSLASSGGGAIALTSVERADLRGGDSPNTFTVSDWTGTASLDARGNDDSYVAHFKGSGSGQTAIADSGGDGGDSAVVHGTAGPDTLSVTASTVTRAAETVSYLSIEGLTVNGHAGADTIHVRATWVATPVVVNAGADDDTINVGSHSNSLDGLRAPLTVNGDAPAASDVLNVNDQGDPDPHAYVLTATTVRRSGAATITYATVESLTVNGGSGGNAFNIRGTHANTATTVNAGQGSDALTVDSDGGPTDPASGTVDGVVSALTIHGQGGNNTLRLEDFSDPDGDTVHVDASQIGAHPDDDFFGPGGRLIYTGLPFIYLNLSNGYDPDTAYLKPSAQTTFSIHGNEPDCPLNPDQLPGDALYLDFSEVSNPKLSSTDDGHGVWTFDPPHQPVEYSGFEEMNHVQIVVVAADVGQEPVIHVIRAETGEEILTFLAFEGSYRGGTRVAVGDTNCDAIPDIIVAAGPSRAPEVRVFSGATGALLASFYAYDPGSRNSLFVAAGDLNRDGITDVITGAESGGAPVVKVFTGVLDGSNALSFQQAAAFAAYDRSFSGGVRLAVADITGDDVPDIITAPGAGGRPEIKVFDGTTVGLPLVLPAASFLAFGVHFHGGVYVAAGDVTGDGRADIIAGQGHGGSWARIFDGTALGSPAVASWQPYGGQFGDGIRVAAVDLDGDGIAEIVTAAGSGNRAPVKAFRFTVGTLEELAGLFDPNDPNFRGRRWVAGGQ